VYQNISQTKAQHLQKTTFSDLKKHFKTTYVLMRAAITTGRGNASAPMKVHKNRKGPKQKVPVT
jgi:hypothetical protein